MDKQLIETTLKKVKDNSPKKNFNQSLDLIINLKGLDLKKTEHNVNMYVTLHHNNGKKVSVCALVGPELEGKAKEVCEEIVLADQFEKYKNKTEVKKLANRHDFFIAQAPLMAKIATTFGRYLGPKGKMPNPKIGSILPPNANVKQTYEKLKNTVKLVTKNEPTIKCRVGSQDSPDDSIVDNVMLIYNSVVQKLPNEQNNVKSVMLKLTMGPSFVVGKEKEDTKGKKGIKPKVQKKTQQEKNTTENKEETKEKPKKVQSETESKTEEKSKKKDSKKSEETKETKKTDNK